MKAKFKVGQTVHAMSDGKYNVGTVVFHKDTPDETGNEDFAHRYCVEFASDIETFRQYELFDTKKELMDSMGL